MAYTAEQKLVVAHELARSGGNVQAALRRLRDEYETLRSIGDATVRRMLREEGFAELVAQRAAIIAEGERRAAVEGEQARRLAEIRGSLMERLTADELLLDDARKRLEAVISTLDAPVAVQCYGQLARIIERRRESTLPAVAQTAEATALVEALSETLIAKFGLARANGLIAEIRKAYVKKIETLNALGAVNASAPAQGA